MVGYIFRMYSDQKYFQNVLEKECSERWLNASNVAVFLVQCKYYQHLSDHGSFFFLYTNMNVNCLSYASWIYM